MLSMPCGALYEITVALDTLLVEDHLRAFLGFRDHLLWTGNSGRRRTFVPVTRARAHEPGA